jgi:hypothetical protein
LVLDLYKYGKHADENARGGEYEDGEALNHALGPGEFAPYYSR